MPLNKETKPNQMWMPISNIHNLQGEVVNILDSDIKVSSNSSRANTFTLEIIPFGKVWTSEFLSAIG